MSLRPAQRERVLEPLASPLAPHVINQFVGLWNGDPGSARFLKEGTNSTFQFRRNDEDLILRVHHSGDRTSRFIRAELEWVSFLDLHGVAVAPPVAAANGEWVQTTEWERRTIYAAVFRHVPGINPVLRVGARWNAALLRRVGRMLGRMHRLSQKYEILPGTRPHWPDLDLPRFAEGLTPTEDLPYLRNLRAHWEWVQSLPRDEPGAFGLVHGDFHSDNLLVRGTRVTAIDFDGSCYSWYLSDIAKFIGMSVLHVWSEDIAVRRASAEPLFTELMRGYVMEHRLGSEWFEVFPEFLRSFFFAYYFSLLARFHFDPSLRQDAPGYPIVRSFVMTDRPFLDLDFRRLYQEAQRGGFLSGWRRKLFALRR